MNKTVQPASFPCRPLVISGLEQLRKLVSQQAGAQAAVVLIDADSLQEALRICHQVRKAWPALPVLIILPHDRPRERTQALLSGADDCLSRPFDPCELQARMLALLRCTGWPRPGSGGSAVFGRNVVDFVKWRVLRDGKPVPASYKELLLLRYLIERSGTAVSRKELLREVWDYQSTATRTVDVHIAGLRQKLEDNPRTPEYLLTVRGKGYMFRNISSNVRKSLHGEIPFEETVSHETRLLLQEGSSKRTCISTNRDDS
jgi:two-component system alkaline phosphatase synthesis response regulator PhoP